MARWLSLEWVQLKRMIGLGPTTPDTSMEGQMRYTRDGDVDGSLYLARRNAGGQMEWVDITGGLMGASSTDAFGRLRISEPTTLFDASFDQSLDQEFLFHILEVTSGTVGGIAGSSRMKLSTSTGSGSRAVLRSKQYIRYIPGKSQLFLATGAFSSPTANNIQRIGMFDDLNGLFFEQTSSTVNVVIRSDADGSGDTKVAQADWNVDVMDGAGPSGKTVDWAKAQIFVIDYQWLGVGTVRWGLSIEGTIYYVHKSHHANTNPPIPYQAYAALPVCFENVNTGTAVAKDLYIICTSVQSEGGGETQRSFQFSTNMGTTSIGVTTRRPILSIRPRLTFDTDRNRTTISPSGVGVYATGNACLWEVVYGGTLTGASFANVDATYSGTMVDTSATAISGGVVIDSGYLAAAASTRVSADIAFITKVPLSLSYDGTDSDNLSIVITSLTGTSTVLGQIEWSEIY